ncbi:MAG: hypothetical protein ABI488_11365 [Polyangiaceae bacterium]
MNVTVAQLNVCTQATIAQTCDEWIEVTPPVCAPPGAEAEGVGCELDGQCASGYCNTGAYPSYCGKCAPRLGTGQPCDPQAFPCALGLRCTYSCPGAWCALTDRAWLCEVPKAEHEPCAFASECRGVLSCVAGACARPATMGQACDESVDDCSHDTICRASQPPDTGATCLKTSFGGPGAVCNSSIAQFCAGGSVCVNAAGTTQVDQGMCVATGLPGQACVVGLCAQPARCVNDACVVPPDAATCQ